MKFAIPGARGELFRYNLVDVHFLPEITEEEKEHKARELARTKDWEAGSPVLVLAPTAN